MLDTPPPDGIAGLVYPEPDAPHPASDAAMAHKIRTARAEAGGARIAAFAHAYGPTTDVVRRTRVAWEASDGHVWLNRYGYLSDAKFAALKEVVR